MDLSKLSKEDKLKLLEALEEQSRRKLAKKDLYKPNDGQLQVHRSEAQTRLVVSGNGAGKTTMAAHEAIWSAQGFNPITQSYIPVPRKVGVVLDKPEKVADKWWPELNKWFVTSEWKTFKNGKPYVNQLILPNGSEVKFFFHDQDELTFESIEVDDLVFDEPPPRSVYISLLRGQRNRGKKARILIIGTPITGAWLRKEIYEPWSNGELEDTECFRFGTSVNESHLPDGYVDWYSSKLTEKERRIRLHGEFFDLEGLALAHLFKPAHLLQPNSYEWNMSNPCVVAIDPHPEKKNTALLVGADQYGPVVVKELALKETSREFARSLKDWYKGYRLIDIVCDDYGSGASTGGEGFKSFIQVLNEEGVRARATTYNDKHDPDWINRIQEALLIPTEPNSFGTYVPKLRVLAHLRGIINDIETVEWQKYKNLDEFKPTLSIESKDFLACLKYALATNISQKKEKDRIYYRKDERYGMDFEKRAIKKIKMGIKRPRS